MHRLTTAAALPLLLAAAGLLGAGLPGAAASPSTDAFQPLLQELNTREGSLPSSGLTKDQKRWKKALVKSFRALEMESTGVAGDLRIGGRIAKSLEKGYPGDPTLGSLVSGALGDLEDLVVAGRDQLEVTASLLADGTPKTKALSKLALADDRIGRSRGASAASSRARELGRAQKFIDQGSAAAAKGDPGGPSGASSMKATIRGQPWAANSDFGTAVSGLAAVAETTNELRRVLVRGRRILPGSGTPPLPGDESTLELSLQAVSGALQPGTWTVGNSGGVSAGASWIEETEAGLSNGLAVSGTITLSTVSVKAGSVTVTGGFSLTIWDGVTGGTFTASSGLFEAYDLPRTAE